MAASISRQELYDLVWSVPLTTVSSRLELTYSQLKKACKDYEIPLPKNGYWSKLKFKKEVEIIKLRTFKTETIDLSKYRRLKVKAVASQLKIGQSKEGKPEVKPSVSRGLRNKKIDIYTIDYSKTQEDKSLIKTQVYLKDVLSVYSDSKVYNRGLAFADQFISVFKERGHKIIFVKNHKYTFGNGLKFDFYGERFELFMRETQTRVMVQERNYSWKSASYHLNGRIAIKWNTSYGKDWVEPKAQTLENKIPNIIDFFEERARYDIELRAEHKVKAEVRKLKEAEDARVAKIKAKEISDFKLLINSSGRWHKSQQLRNYLSTYEDKMKSNGELTKEVMDWLDWARKKADWYDPFIEAEDDIFQDVDRDSF
jgi:hypothetical protein